MDNYDGEDNENGVMKYDEDSNMKNDCSCTY